MSSTEQGGYVASHVTVVVDGLIMSGMATDDFVEWDHDTDDSAVYEGADGHVAVALMPEERAGFVRFKLAQTSLANNQLQALLATKKVVSIVVRNPWGGEGCVMARGTLKKAPPGAFGRTVKDRTWEFVGKLRKVHGGYAL